jgi:hypothetical protein
MCLGILVGSMVIVPDVVVVPSANSKIVANFSPPKGTSTHLLFRH